jgi:phosphate transport system substrate-binding protein
MVLKKHGVKLAEHARRFESSMELSDRVSQDPGAIGFIGLPYVLRAKALAVADEEGGLPVFPTTFTVSTEDYPLSRRLYMYEPMTLSLQSPAHQFISFVASEEGQEVVRRSGFISQNIQRIQPVLGPELPQEYLSLVQGGSRLSLNFRFNSGTFELDNKAQRDLERVIRFFEMNPGQRAFLIGFSDSTPNTTAGCRCSEPRWCVISCWHGASTWLKCMAWVIWHQWPPMRPRSVVSATVVSRYGCAATPPTWPRHHAKLSLLVARMQPLLIQAAWCPPQSAIY